MALYCKGMTTRDIQATVKELYGVEVSHTLVSEVVKKRAKIGQKKGKKRRKGYHREKLTSSY
jgi:transposase-like protein